MTNKPLSDAGYWRFEARPDTPPAWSIRITPAPDGYYYVDYQAGGEALEFICPDWSAVERLVKGLIEEKIEDEADNTEADKALAE